MSWVFGTFWFIYVVSVFSVGLFVLCDIDLGDFIMMIFPILNTFILIKWMCNKNRFKIFIQEIKEKIRNI